MACMNLSKEALREITVDVLLHDCQGKPKSVDMLLTGLQQAVRDERYEDAAIYRDELTRRGYQFNH